MPRSETVMVGATGTRRRVQALGFMGHTRAALAGRLGVTADQLTYALYQQDVPEDLADRVKRLYDELWNVIPTGPAADRARAAARRRGWVSPLAWNDEDIDDPAAVPDLGHQAGTRAEALTEDSDWLLRFRYPFDHVAARLGVTPDYLKRAREHARRAAREAVAA